jgi:hypothetical protein
MAYAAFLLADTKSVSSLSVMITAAFLGAMLGFCLGIMFATHAVCGHGYFLPFASIRRPPTRDIPIVLCRVAFAHVIAVAIYRRPGS